ncbi:glycoside hydrolase family 95 protein [Spirosoma koreense]
MIRLSILSLLIALTAQAQPPARQPLTLWYKQPARQWVEALPIGNGRLGGMVYGGIQEDQIQFNEQTLWTGQPREYQREGAAKYLPQIRRLLADGKQAEAEKLAQEKFMGQQSHENDYLSKKEAWFTRVRDLNHLKANPTTASFDDSSWKTMAVPTAEGWEKAGPRQAGLEGLDGAVWFRTSFDLPQAWSGKDVVLDMGRIRDQDFTYLNGELIGTSEGITKNRRYKISAAKLHVGKNQLAIQVINLFDKGGFIGVKTSQPTFVVYPDGQQPTDGVPLNQPFRYWVQDDAPPASPHYQADYQPFGNLRMRFSGQGTASHYRFELDLAKALSRVTYTASGVRYTREYLASAPNQVIAVHLTASEPGHIAFQATLDSPHKGSDVRQIDNQTIALSVQVRDGALRGESLLHIQTRNGKIIVSGDKLIISGADEATLYLTAGTNFKRYDDVSGDPAVMSQRPLQAVRTKRFEVIKAAHINEYQTYFNTLSLDLGHSASEQYPTDERLQRFEKAHDPDLVALYLQYGRYLLISSSRPGQAGARAQPANLQGIWNDLLTPPWGSKYTTNINLEMNYWPAEPLNLSACHESLFSAIEELVESGRKTAKAHYNARGWVLHHNTDLWRGTAPINASNHGIWVSGGAWLSHHLWAHYRYSQDRAFLQKRGYPIMKEAAQFFVDFLVKDPKTGWLISTPSNSPEHGGLVAGPTMDHQIIRDLFKNCIAASQVLGTDVAFRDTLKTMYSQIAPNQIGRHGQLQEWLQDIDDPADHHRHVSHLWGVHPGTDITWDDTPDLMKAARQSLLERGDEGTGWSLAWKINFWARFRDGDHAYNMLRLLFRPAISPEGTTGGGSYPNLFDAHPPFQIDGNFGGASGIAEMLLQSQGKTIDLLPALPSDLPTGYIHGICAQGGFVLDIRWQNGRLSGVTVTSRAGQPCVLRYGDKQVQLTTEKGKTYKLDGSLNVIV